MGLLIWLILFSGDFNYNIPLLDVEGYPVNIYYHAGVTVEQEASWVGLGWNINPGNINHIVRGFSDDYDGDVIEKELKIKDESNKYFNVFFGVEAAGVPLDKLFGAAKKALQNSKITGGGQMNFGMNFNSYTGVSATFGVTGSVSVKGKGKDKDGNKPSKEQIPWLSGGINMGAAVSTDKGVDVDYSFTARSLMSKAVSADVGASAGGKMNSREGMKYSSWGVNPYFDGSEGQFGSIGNTYIPTGLQNYVPVITNATRMNSFFVQLKVGGEAWSLYPFGGGGYGENIVKVEEDGSKRAFGYFNLGNASSNDIMDFAREKDGNVNRSTKFLPLASMTYDIYSVNGHGTGGSFRPYRNDIGTVHDPELGSHNSDDSHLAEAGLGNTFELGYDYKTATTISNSGPWKNHNRKFSKKSKGSLYEPYYLKMAGELTPRNEKYYNEIQGKDALKYSTAKNIGNNLSSSSNSERVTRANLLYFLNSEEASRQHVSLLPKFENYDFDDFSKQGNWIPYDAGTNPDGIKLIDRVGAVHKEHLASEFTQVKPDGQRYVYGLPVMNVYQKDFELGVLASTSTDEFSNDHYEASFADYSSGLPNYTSPNEYVSKTTMPSYAHSYMLTAVLSADYVDLTGNGITEDDLGSYTKFNYRKRDNYLWRAPYGKRTTQRNRGLRADCKDDKGSFSGGERELWVLHSIESRNFVAEFHTSERLDSKGADGSEAMFDNNIASKSYKLDEIVLFNKWDRFENETNATPLQTIVFSYDYSLCPGTPNSTSSTEGKLTLKSIFIKKGKSEIGYLSPYQFKYNGKNENYDKTAKDCWGNYKPKAGNLLDGDQDNNINLNNLDYPYVNQNDPDIDTNSYTWNLEEIIMPSGGKIKVSYESDDYAYVQDKKAMEMFKVEGVGPTTKFVANNTLYHSAQNPYLYVYFKRRTAAEHGNDIASTYLADGSDIIQFNFDVLMSQGRAASCGQTPLIESVKGYARVVQSGVCDNTDYGYLKLEPRTANTSAQLEKIGIHGAKLNPITLAAINFARFNAPKILNPEMDMPNVTGKALVNAFKSALGDFASFFQNALKAYLDKGKAQTFTIGKSYVRLVNPGLKKKGGGHRVKKLEFVDNWAGASQGATYGSEYDYTVPLPGTNMRMSSGVASYEPLFGGDENPCRTLMVVNEIGNSSKFPAVNPIELQQESPLGESMYPPASVGYSKITVTSIHKDDGESSQTIQEFEHYTARDFPVKAIQATHEPVLEDKKPKFYNIFNKEEIYRVAQGYSLELNDMHGKLKQTSTWVAKYDPANLSSNPDSRELVAYTKYNYFTNDDNTIKNTQIPCLKFVDNDAPQLTLMTLGEHVEITLDSRQKVEKTNLKDFHFSTNGFLAPPIPILIPLGFPKFKKQSKTFSSFVNTKITQKYGIIKSVESYNKGALVVAENYAFDANTGQPLITTVNTEYGDNEYSIKYPAYWAYRCMGAAYENILFEEDLQRVDALNDPACKIRDDVAYLSVANQDKYNIGDEIELELEDLCANTTGAEGKTYKLWVTDKGFFNPTPWSCSTATNCSTNSGANSIMYDGIMSPVRSTAFSPIQVCKTETQLKDLLYEVTQDPEIYNIKGTIGYCSIEYYNESYPISGYTYTETQGACTTVASLSFPGVLALAPVGAAIGPPSVLKQIIYNCVIDPSVTNIPVPNQSRFQDKIVLQVHHRFQTKRGSANNSFVFNDKALPTKKHPDQSIAAIEIDVWNDVPAASIQNQSALLLNPKSTYSLYNPGASVQGAPSCGAYLEIRAGVYNNRYGFESYDRWPKKNIIVAKPYKKGAPDVGLSNNASFPENDDIVKGSVKVIRSGKRNMLTAPLQEMTIVADPTISNQQPLLGSPGKLNISSTRVVNSSARTYTDTADVPYGLDADYHNPFVTGEKGNYRVGQTYSPIAKRLYPDGAANTESDRYKGLYSGSALWGFGASRWDPLYNPEYKNKMYIPMGYQVVWRNDATYHYGAWGKPINVVDALSHSNTILYDFDNRIPSATVTNLYDNSAIYESFEDAKELHKYDENPIRNFFNPLRYDANPLKSWLRTQVVPGTSPSNGELLSDGTSHSGKHALKFIQNTDISITVAPFMYFGNVLSPFYLYNSPKKYIASCWQKVSTNGAAPPATSGVEIKWGSLSTEKAQLKAITPVIDGWVLYEAIFDIPGAYGSATISATANTIIDDFRLLPAESSMKAYVYDPLYRRIVATLDENHMTTFFEYDDQGKLVRVKKETEKGILTIKESRESLKELISSFTY